MPPARAAAAIALLAAGLAGSAGAGEGLSPNETRVLQQVCAACHARPGIGVPLLGDDAAWAPRREKGLETLLRNTVDGFRGMPPLGTCGACSESELRRLTALMAGLPMPPPEKR